MARLEALTVALSATVLEGSETAIVNPDDAYVLDPTDHPVMTLVTCYPFEFIGHAPRRYIVSADLVADAER